MRSSNLQNVNVNGSILRIQVRKRRSSHVQKIEKLLSSFASLNLASDMFLVIAQLMATILDNWITYFDGQRCPFKDRASALEVDELKRKIMKITRPICKANYASSCLMERLQDGPFMI